MENETWNCDVAVIGGGAAGMAAAIRIRHMKEDEGLPLSVAIIDPSSLGGLLKTGGKRLVTGPSMSIESSRLLADLKADVDKFEIPVLPFRVDRIDRTGTGSFLLDLDDGSAVEAMSVVVATGCRPLTNEFDWDKDGIYVTYRGVSFLGRLIERARERAGERPIAVITNRNIRATLPLFWRYEGDYLFIVPPGQEFELNSLPGSVVAANDWSIKGIEDDAFVLELDTPENGRIEPWAGAILLDYVSFQRGPYLPIFGFEMEHRSPGILKVDEFLATSEPGIFMAGDVTGRYATVTAALADGISAAIGAYGHVYRLRFGETPPLFQLAEPERDERFFDRELPVLQEADVVEWLQTPPAGHPLALSGNMTLGEAATETGFSLDQVYSLTYQAIRDRYVTIRPAIRFADDY